MSTKYFHKKFHLIIFLILLISSSTLAQTNWHIKWSIKSEGGGFSASTSYNIFDTIGFNMFGPMSSSSYNLSGGATTITDVNNPKKGWMIPNNFELQQNYPNPFNPTTNIQFELPKIAHVELLVYNVLGQKVKTLVNKQFKAGYHHLIWDATNDNGTSVGSGTYIFLIRVKSDNNLIFQESKKMSLIR